MVERTGVYHFLQVVSLGTWSPAWGTGSLPVGYRRAGISLARAWKVGKEIPEATHSWAPACVVAGHCRKLLTCLEVAAGTWPWPWALMNSGRIEP